jgi:hypothetical protein
VKPLTPGRSSGRWVGSIQGTCSGSGTPSMSRWGPDRRARVFVGVHTEIELLLPASQPLPSRRLERLHLLLVVRGTDVLHPARTAPLRVHDLHRGRPGRGLHRAHVRHDPRPYEPGSVHQSAHTTHRTCRSARYPGSRSQKLARVRWNACSTTSTCGTSSTPEDEAEERALRSARSAHFRDLEMSRRDGVPRRIVNTIVDDDYGPRSLCTAKTRRRPLTDRHERIRGHRLRA